MDASQIQKLFKDRIVLLVFLDLLFLALPGILALFVLDQNIFLSLDWIKLILLASSFVLPAAFINTIVILWSWEEATSKEDDLFFAFSLGSIFAGLAFFFALAIRYFPHSFAPSYIVSIFIIEMIIFFIIAYDKYNSKKWLSSQRFWGTSEKPETQSQIEQETEPVAPTQI